MFKKALILGILLSLLSTCVAFAEVTNRDMQLLGGVVVSNATDSFFFCPMEEGVTRHWGLYKLSTASEGPIWEVKEGFPARLVHADAESVYFMGYTDARRSIHSLYKLTLSTNNVKELLSDIKSAFVGEDETSFLYVTGTDPYTLYQYDLQKAKGTKIKDMSNSKKAIYDACVYKGGVFFITKTESGAEDGYEYHASSGKATNLDKPSPQLMSGLLYEGYRVYANDSSGTRIYAVKLGNKTASPIGEKLNVSLSNPRFGEAIYTYDGETNSLVRCPLDGSASRSLPLEGGGLTRMIIGGSKDEIFLAANSKIYSIKPDLSGKTELFDFPLTTGGQVWNYIAPAGSDAVVMMGYDAATYTHMDTMLPTGVYAYSRSGELLFSYPNLSEEDLANRQMPDVIGEVPVEEKEEGESYFIW